MWCRSSHTSDASGSPGRQVPPPQCDLVGRSAWGSRQLSGSRAPLYVPYVNRLEVSWPRGLHSVPLGGALVTDPWVTLIKLLV